jgi:magnesium-transporting ATPase (P-type)
MATLHHDHAGQHFVLVKGAAETLFPRCITQRGSQDTEAFQQAFWSEQVERIAAKGQRTLAIATRSVTAETTELQFSDIQELCMLGIVGITDPPRAEAIDAVAECQAAGIRVKMITGDHATTAVAIADQLGISGDGRALSGVQLDQLDTEELKKQVQQVDVFARASPEHKLRLVEAIQSNGQVLAMTGDGVNDAPALKRADVGVAMGLKGTEAAKQAAEMVLADDNFASIMHAVREGRTVYDNIKKSILFILPTNGGEALTILAAIALGKMLPVTAAQILWVNMITAVTLALALAFEPAEANIMQRPPRSPKEPLLSRFMVWRILFVSTLMVIGTFGLFVWERANGADIETARTVAVNALVIAEIFYLLNVRFLTASVLNRQGLLGNRYVLIAIALVILFQLLFTYLPFMQHVFSTKALDGGSWVKILAFGGMLFIAVELEKWLFARSARKPPADNGKDSAAPAR